MDTATVPSRSPRFFTRSTDSYGALLLLILLNYVATATLTGSHWGRVCIVLIQGVTILFSLHISRSRFLWQMLALVYLVVTVLAATIAALAPVSTDFGKRATIVGGVLLIVTPFVISRRIASHTVISTETVLGAISVYLLIGMSFAYIYSATGALSSTPFFHGKPRATINDYLFFSYTTLTTVGYGNLVPAGYLGQTFAMLEALSGQIYLVIVVARLVSLWGQKRPPVGPRRPSSNDAAPAGDRRNGAGTTAAE
jgi:hypothetical protein